jgi:hypothetical protein
MSNEDTVSCLARYLLQVKPGERLQTVRQIARVNRTSVGSVSNALSIIEQTGAVTIDRRGHLGSFLGKRSISGLWNLAEHEPMVLSFPLIAHPLLEGLATGLKRQISAAGIDVYLTFIRGSRTRLKALQENKCHIAVMSGFAASRLCGETEQLLMTLPPQSFVTRHEVFYLPTLHEIRDRRLRVAIDEDSMDIAGLTELEFEGQDVDFKPVTFMQLPRLLKDGCVDAGIWSIDDMRAHLNDQILHRQLSYQVVDRVLSSDTAAALMSCREHTSVHAVIEATLDVGKVLEIQHGVIQGEIVPEY